MNIECPVCKTGCTEATTKCNIYGFDDLHRTYNNADDGNYWLKTVVLPYRMKWEASKRVAELLAQLEQAHKKEAELKAQLEQAQKREVVLEALVLETKNENTELIDQLKQVLPVRGIPYSCLMIKKLLW